MTTLYIDRRHADLRVRNRRLEVRLDGVIRQSLPLSLLERVVIGSPVDTDTATLTALAGAGIGVAMLHGRKDRNIAALTGLPGGDARRRLAQYAAWHNESMRRTLVQDLLRLKLRAQYRFVTHLLRARPDARRELIAAQKLMKEQLRRLRDSAPDLAVLRGIEGAASAAGFRALKAVMPPALGFENRRRRPPPDPVNAVLSLGYTLACYMALESACAAGLDPAIGYLHEPLTGRHSLASDLMEPLRPRVERFAWECFRKRVLRAEHFFVRDGACLLDKSGRAVFYPAWEKRAPAMRRWLRRVVRELVVRLLENEDA